MMTTLNCSSSSSLILQPLKPPKPSKLSRFSKPRTLILTVTSSSESKSLQETPETTHLQIPQKSIVWQLKKTSMINVVRPSWISKLEPYNGMWHLSENGKPQRQFDIIIIAHNGKCANRLLGSSGLPLIARQMKRLELNSIWALLAAFEDPLPIAGPEQFEDPL
ncbi:hypothetical protein LWI28_019682 [Acer negundo]|uniref:Uncharacterized protein n=1 Tax=Acer negundo TaxID=4023 RepID=A0AAD5J6G6_ACENE|nr:hypothetical protein LWI28_019682 [Acer negundo]